MRIFSGIRPTGEIHLGNYLGAIKNWLVLQEEHECIFCIVDWHALTTPYNPDELRSSIQEIAIAYLASGINPEKTTLFVQSHVKEHAELAWLLGIIAPVGELSRMTQYKEKSQDVKGPSAGLLNYPILMAADILLYQTDIVPVGNDQVQHIEFTKDIARRFNNRFGKTFKIPTVQIPKLGAKIKSLTDPDKKMSKSGDQKGCIGLFEEMESIRKKIINAVTDTGKEIKYDPKNKPGISNLLEIYSGFSKEPILKIEKRFKGKNYSEFKEELFKLLVKSLSPFREFKKQTSEQEIKEILEKGAQKAQKIAKPTIEKARQQMGLT